LIDPLVYIFIPRYSAPGGFQSISIIPKGFGYPVEQIVMEVLKGLMLRELKRFPQWDESVFVRLAEFKIPLELVAGDGDHAGFSYANIPFECGVAR
jgi:hypothetical protein